MNEVNYKGKLTTIKRVYTDNPHSDEWHIYGEDCAGRICPVSSETMPKGWMPSKTVRVNGILGV
jgi:hypothetical protein